MAMAAMQGANQHIWSSFICSHWSGAYLGFIVLPQGHFDIWNRVIEQITRRWIYS